MKHPDDHVTGDLFDLRYEVVQGPFPETWSYLGFRDGQKVAVAYFFGLDAFERAHEGGEDWVARQLGVV